MVVSESTSCWICNDCITSPWDIVAKNTCTQILETLVLSWLPYWIGELIWNLTTVIQKYSGSWWIYTIYTQKILKFNQTSCWQINSCWVKTAFQISMSKFGIPLCSFGFFPFVTNLPPRPGERFLNFDELRREIANDTESRWAELRASWSGMVDTHHESHDGCLLFFLMI